MPQSAIFGKPPPVFVKYMIKKESVEDEALIQALSKPIDYSDRFDQVVEQVCDKLSQTFGMKFFHDYHMNYSSAQTIELWLDKAHEPVSSRSAASYGIRIFISSKGNFFAVRCITQEAAKHWRPIPDNEHDAGIKSYIKRITKFFNTEGYILLPQSTLSKHVDGHLTRLDKLPATVFQVLFSELG